jgi:hypothetical protein
VIFSHRGWNWNQPGSGAAICVRRFGRLIVDDLRFADGHGQQLGLARVFHRDEYQAASASRPHWGSSSSTSKGPVQQVREGEACGPRAEDTYLGAHVFLSADRVGGVVAEDR